jgi:CheY-like chemotaxis protein
MALQSDMVMEDFDPHFKVFHDLMPFKVQEILLVSSLYDAFIMEEDGSLATRLINEYHGLNLSKPPKITRVGSPEEALHLLDSRKFDLVITMPYLGGMDAFALAEAIKKHHPNLPVILVAHNVQNTFPDKVDSGWIDKIFLWCCEADLLLAIVKNVEDHRNVDADTKKAMVRVIIYVEDSPLYRALFLPLIYSEVVRQTQSVLDESLNERHRILRMRARPRILMATNFEEAMALYQAYKPYVFAVISDARYKREGRLDSRAGIDFLHRVRAEITDLPLLLVSTEQDNRVLAEAIPAIFLDKNSPLLRDQVHQFFLEYLGFGDFIFRLPDGRAIASAANLQEFERQLRLIPEESLRYHALRNHFSNWIMARAEVILARRLHRDYFGSINDISELRDDLIHKVRSLRKLRQRGVVARFSANDYDIEVMDFVKIGNGSMGGKARGLAFIWALLQGGGREESLLSTYPVTIPKTCVITADGFTAFVAENNLHIQAKMSDEHIADIFLDAPLPAWLRQELRAFLQKCDQPLSVRSSSLMEDGHFKPYAGLYSTYFLANRHADFSERLAQLESAVKLVYASTWFESPMAFSRVAGHGRDDAMAVIIQQVAGADYHGHWYPAISGVAQSRNYYPVLDMQGDDGIVNMALGIGKTVVEGGKSLWFSPTGAEKPVQFATVDNMLKTGQQEFYALDLEPRRCFHRYHSNLTRRNIHDAEQERPVTLLCSTYVAEEERVRDGCLPGPKIITFAPILKYSQYPLATLLGELLKLGKVGMGGDVEIEFAVDLREDISTSVLYVLQIRPMIGGGTPGNIHISASERARAFCSVDAALGHGIFDTITDIVYVHPDRFEIAKTREVAEEIGAFNRLLRRDKRPFLLIGPGRWGSADPYLGIPVQWADISGVAAIVEARSGTLKAEPSQGTHFFQNITSLGIPYLTLDEGRPTSFLLWERLHASPRREEGRFVSHVSLDIPLLLKCDGVHSQAVVLFGEDALPMPDPRQDRAGERQS